MGMPGLCLCVRIIVLGAVFLGVFFLLGFATIRVRMYCADPPPLRSRVCCLNSSAKGAWCRQAGFDFPLLNFCLGSVIVIRHRSRLSQIRIS